MKNTIIISPPSTLELQKRLDKRTDALYDVRGEEGGGEEEVVALKMRGGKCKRALSFTH